MMKLFTKIFGGMLRAGDGILSCRMQGYAGR